MSYVAAENLYFMTLIKLGVKAEPPPEGWAEWNDGNWTLDENNADYSVCTLDQLEVIMMMTHCDNEVTHIIADGILCEVIRRLATISEYYQDDHAPVALRIVEAFKRRDKWYS